MPPLEELVYGSEPAPVITLEVESMGGAGGARCLVRAPGLPVIVLPADHEATSLSNGNVGHTVRCPLDDRLLARLEGAGASNLEVALAGRGLQALSPGVVWVALPIRERVTVASVYPTSLILIPGHKSRVYMAGSFQTLLRGMGQSVGEAKRWTVVARDASGASIGKPLTLEEVRHDRLVVSVAGADIAAGVSCFLEISLAGAPGLTSRTLARSLVLIELHAHRPVVDFWPRIALASDPVELQVTLELAHPPAEGKVLACAQRRPASTGTLSWTPASALGPSSFRCLLERGGPGAREVGLGYYGDTSEGGQLLTNLVKVITAPIEVESISPAQGPTSGGTIVTLRGRGFLALPSFGGGLLCQFGGGRGSTTEANPVTDKLMTCEAPKASRAAVLTVTLQAQNSTHHSVILGGSPGTLRLRTFTYYAPPVITSVHPRALSPTDLSSLTLTASLRSAIEGGDGMLVVCRLELQADSRGKQPTITTRAFRLTDTAVACPFSAWPAWLSSAQACSLSLSLNGGVDFSPPYGGIEVLAPALVHEASSHELGSSDASLLVLDLTGAVDAGADLGCHIESPADGREWFFPAHDANSTHVSCLDGASVLAGLRAGQATVSLYDAAVGRVSQQKAWVPALAVAPGDRKGTSIP